MRDPGQAVAIAHAMLAKGLKLNAQWRAVARFAMSEGEWPLAIGAMRAFVASDPAALEPNLALAELLVIAGRTADARRVLEDLNRTFPNTAQILHFLGVALIETGDSHAGVAHLDAALRLRPGSGATWLALVHATRSSDGAMLDRLADVCGRAPDAERATLLYALGKLLEGRGEHARAFTAYADGARRVAVERVYDAAADRAEAMTTLQRPDVRAAIPSPRRTGPAPIFITGKPRSGTTLVEQLMASDADVGSGGELNILGLAGRSPPSGSAATASVDAWATVVRNRYAHLASLRLPGHGRIVDKSLNTSRFAGMVRVAMPDAPLIWLRRDPFDTAWSSFRTYFSQGLAWSFDMVAMARFHALEDALYAFWKDAYGAQLLAIDYADLVNDPATMVARLQSHCGLTPNPRALDYHKDGRTVRTASVAQVRQPINRDGIGVAAPYREQLDTFAIAYDAARASFGLPAI